MFVRKIGLDSGPMLKGIWYKFSVYLKTFFVWTVNDCIIFLFRPSTGLKIPLTTKLHSADLAKKWPSMSMKHTLERT